MLPGSKNNGRFATAQSRRGFAGGKRNSGRIPLDVHVRNMVGDFRSRKGSCDPRNPGDLTRNIIEAALPFLVQGVVIFLQIRFQGLDHADDFFLTHFLAAAEGVFVRTVVEQSIGDQIFFADEQAGALRPANRFSTAESDEVVAHVREIPQT